MLFKILSLSIIFVTFNIFAGENMNSIRYSAYLNTTNGICILSVNGLDYLSTLDGSRTISTGSDITDALENDKENSIGLIFYPSGPRKENKTYTCEIKVVKSSENNQDEIVTNFKILFDGIKNRQFNDPVGYSIQDISDKTNTKIIKGISNKITFNGDEKPEDWHTAFRNFTVSGIPVWQWTKAPPQKNDLFLRDQLIKAYKDLINNLKTSDLSIIKNKYSLALNEYATVDLTDDIELFFNSIGIVDAVQNGKVDQNPDWKQFEVLSFQKDRMFCLAISEANRMSPIQFYDEKGEQIFSWNPFFAMIDGKMVLVR